MNSLSLPCMKKYAVIVAGGTGTRMGNTVPKQFLLLKDKPVLWYTLDTFLRAYNDLEIILVLPGKYTENGKQIADSFLENDRIKTITGGDTRFHSVQCGLKEVKAKFHCFCTRCCAVPCIRSAHTAML